MVPPVPIPNTVVKHVKAESTWLETAREDRKLPVKMSDTPFGVSLILFAFPFRGVNMLVACWLRTASAVEEVHRGKSVYM